MKSIPIVHSVVAAARWLFGRLNPRRFWMLKREEDCLLPWVSERGRRWLLCCCPQCSMRRDVFSLYRHLYGINLHNEISPITPVTFIFTDQSLLLPILRFQSQVQPTFWILYVPTLLWQMRHIVLRMPRPRVLKDFYAIWGEILKHGSVVSPVP